MATYQNSDGTPPTGAGYNPGDILVSPPGYPVASWMYIGDEKWVVGNMVTQQANPLTGGIELSAGGVAVPLPMQTTGLSVQNGRLYLNGAYCRELGLNAFSLVQTQLATPTSTDAAVSFAAS